MFFYVSDRKQRELTEKTERGGKKNRHRAKTSSRKLSRESGEYVVAISVPEE